MNGLYLRWTVPGKFGGSCFSRFGFIWADKHAHRDSENALLLSAWVMTSLICWNRAKIELYRTCKSQFTKVIFDFIRTICTAFSDLIVVFIRYKCLKMWSDARILCDSSWACSWDAVCRQVVACWWTNSCDTSRANQTRYNSATHGPSTRPVNSASGNARPSTRPELTGYGNQSPVN